MQEEHEDYINKEYEQFFKCPVCKEEYEEVYAVCITCKCCSDCCLCNDEDQELMPSDEFLQKYDPFNQ